MCSIDYLITLFEKWLPAIIGIAAIYYSNRNVSKQIRLSAQVQWKNEFRKEVANLISLNYKLRDPKLIKDIRRSRDLIGLYLDEKNALHIEFMNVFKRVANFYDPSNIEPFNEKIEDKLRHDLIDITQKIIDERSNI